jgi:hypothetical protein
MNLGRLVKEINPLWLVVAFVLLTKQEGRADVEAKVRQPPGKT